MDVMSVNAMIRHAKSNAKLYEEMVGLGYSDKTFPVWWYSPARGAAGGGPVAQKGGEAGEAGEVSIEVDKVEGEEGYDPIPPRTPASKEGRPALPESPVLSSPVLSDAALSTTVQGPPSFSDAELSLLEDRAVTEITPGRWMHTQSQAEGRIVLMCTRASVPP